MIHIKYPEKWDFKIFDSALILTESLKNAEELYKTRLANDFPRKMSFLIYCETFEDISFPMYHYDESTPGHIFHFAYFFLRDKDYAHLFTYEVDEEVYNWYNYTARDWVDLLVIQEKYKNFNGSTILIMMKAGKPDAYKDDNEIRGIIPDLVKIIAERGNFEYEIILLDGKEEELTGISNVELVFLTKHSAYISEVHCTSSFSQVRMVFEMTPSEKFTNWEKVLLPFDEEIWKFLLITFGVAFGSVFMINKLPRIVKDLVYGEGVQMPAYNILGTFFGVGQLKLPERNFARILLMIFILFCLIIRTAYQGVLFEMMTSEISKKSPQTIEDLYNKNYAIIAEDANWSRTLLTGMIHESHRPKISYLKPHDQLQTFVNQIKNESAKLAFFLTKNPEYKGIQLEEVLLSDTACLVMRRNQFLYWLTEEVLRDLISGGIPQHLEKFYEDMFWPQKKKEESGPNVLKIDDLYYGFIIWIVACLVTLFAFIGEFFVKDFIVKFSNGIKKCLKNILGLVFVVDWLVDYLRSKNV